MNDTEQKKINDRFVVSLSLKNHPMITAKPKIKTQYFAVLEYIVKPFSVQNQYTAERLLEYQKMLIKQDTTVRITNLNREGVIRSIIDSTMKPWRKRYKYWLLCDIALILVNRTDVDPILRFLCNYLNRKQQILLLELFEFLYKSNLINRSIPLVFSPCENLIRQFHTNYEFIAMSPKRFIVTANMSAGKSTLINAIIGKPVTQTSQEACTGNLCYLYNKPFEDNAIAVCASPLRLNVSYNDLLNMDKNEKSSIATYFRTSIHLKKRICIIDTPGVNSALNKNHSKITKRALNEEHFDRLIYVFNANRLGTDEEIRHLRFVTENVPKEKIIFVLNKLDDFNTDEDSIRMSINNLKKDLMNLGYNKPVICPLSAYFALLIKMKQNNETLSERQQKAYRNFVDIFSEKESDLSIYYTENISETTDNELTLMGIKCGLYGLEKILFGGL